MPLARTSNASHGREKGEKTRKGEWEPPLRRYGYCFARTLDTWSRSTVADIKLMVKPKHTLLPSEATRDR